MMVRLLGVDPVLKVGNRLKICSCGLKGTEWCG